MPQFLLFISLLFFQLSLSGQSAPVHLLFEKDTNEVYGLDTCSSTLRERNKNTKTAGFLAVKSIAQGSTSRLIFHEKNNYFLASNNLILRIKNTHEILKFTLLSTNKYELLLPESFTDYTIDVAYDGNTIGLIAVRVLPPKVYSIRIIPTQSTRYNCPKIERELNYMFRFANIKFEITAIHPRIVKKEDTDKLDNPNASRTAYTTQMHEVRDLYFAKHPQKDNNPCYFLIDGFVNETLEGFSVRSKSLGFIKAGSSKSIARIIANEFSYGYAAVNPKDTSHLLDFKANIINNEEAWNQLQNIPAIGSFYDDYENVASSNGLIAYYFWKTNKDGSIKIENGNFLASIKRPYKKKHLLLSPRDSSLFLQSFIHN